MAASQSFHEDTEVLMLTTNMIRKVFKNIFLYIWCYFIIVIYSMYEAPYEVKLQPSLVVQSICIIQLVFIIIHRLKFFLTKVEEKTQLYTGCLEK